MKNELIISELKNLIKFDLDDIHSIQEAYFSFKDIITAFEKWKKDNQKAFDEAFQEKLSAPVVDENGALKDPLVIDKNGEALMMLIYEDSKDYIPNVEKLNNLGFSQGEIYDVKLKSKTALQKLSDNKKILKSDFENCFDIKYSSPKLAVDKKYIQKSFKEMEKNLKELNIE